MVEGVPNWLWPKHEKVNPTGIVRFGRVLHWAFVGVAALPGAAMVAILFAENGDEQERLAIFLGAGSAALLFLLIGRAARYIFAGE